MSAFEEKLNRLVKSYAEIAQHLDPEAREHFEGIPADRRDWFKRKLFEDALVPGVMNQFAYNSLGVGSRPGAHVRLDLNDLKAVNDTHGHEHGNRAIAGFGNAGLESARATGGQFFRTGGDEFHAHFATPDQAYSFLRHLSSRTSALVPIAGSHKLGFSAGLGQTPEHADQALYQAKAAKTAKFGSLRHDPGAVVGHGQHFAHSALPGAAGPVPVTDDPLVPEGVRRPTQRPLPMPDATKP